MSHAGIRTFAMLASELEDRFRLSIVEATLKGFEELSPSRRKLLDPLFAQLRFKGGFRTWDKAPVERVASAAVKGYRDAPPFWAWVFRAWLDLRPTLRDRARSVVEELGIGRLCECVVDDFPHSWEEGTLETAVKNLQAAAAGDGTTVEEARLALQVLGTGAPADEDECPTGEHQPEDESDDEKGGGDKSMNGNGPPGLKGRLEQLAEALVATVPEVRACADELASGGPPAKALIERLGGLEAEWRELRTLVTGLAGRESAATRVGALLEEVEKHEAHREEREAAQGLLEAAAELECEKPLPDLVALKERALAALAAPEHSIDGAWLLGLKALLELAEDDVADERFDTLRQQVSAAFGPSIASAALRRFIRRMAVPNTVRDTKPPSAEVEPPPPRFDATPRLSPIPLPMAERGSELPTNPEPRPPERAVETVPEAPVRAPPGSATVTPFGPPPPPPPRSARSAIECARTALELAENDRAPAAASTVWTLAAEGEYAVAHALARALEGAALGFGPPLAPLLRGLVFGGRVAAQDDAAAMEVLSALTEIDQLAPGPRSIACAALTLRPALLSRASGALGILQGLELDATGNLGRIRELVVRAPALGLEIGPALLGGVQQAGKVRIQLEALARDCAAWLQSARQQKLVFAGATDTWHRLLAPGNPYFELIHAVIANDVSRREELANKVAAIAPEREIERLVRTTEREVRGRKAVTNPIDARAYQGLLKHVADGLAHPQRWLELAQLAQEKRNPALQKFEVWRSELLRAVETGRAWLQADRREDAIENAARTVLQHALANLAGLLSAESVPAPAASSEQVLEGPLLRIATISLDEQWEPRETAAEVATRVLRAVAAGLPSWDEAFAQQLAEGRLLAVNRLLDLATVGLATLTDAEARRQDAAAALERERAALRALQDARNTTIEQTVALDLLSEPERAELVSRTARHDPDCVLEFDVARAEMEEIGAQLAERQEAHARELALRVEKTGIEKSDPAAFKRIRDALDRRDFPTATEYLDASARGESLHAGAGDDLFADVFFPKFVTEYVAADVTLADAIDALSNDRSVGPVSGSALAAGRAQEAAGLLRAWQKAKGRVDALANVAAVLEGLGFRRATLLGDRGPRPTDNVFTTDFQAEELRDRRTCVIPQFGSLARGRYRLACVWGQPSEEELLALVAAPHASPTIALFFGRLPESGRRELARLSRELRRQLVIIDEVLIAFLAMQPGARLPVLFRCALPFTVAEPYVTSAGLVPREMFFGRDRERQAIFDPLGTNLVYGGRQLGKTALLREVERAHHDPGRGVIVVWTDLKQEGIGRERDAKAVWEVIGRLLEQHGVVKKGTVGFLKIRERVLEWLKGDAARRIVLLLDEADLFLSADRQAEAGLGYATLHDLKRLLDESQKRFKFVLAGLHDVQRTSRDPNTPLAHLGSPLCIGPLMGDGEAHEARALIEAPLSPLGYRFAHPDLPTRILSHTNYYPSLIQLFCWHLLDHVSNARKVPFNPRTSPPYVITAQHVDEAYRSQKLRGAIRDRFKWTLDLDLRYKLIALLIALESLERPAALAEGFTAKDIQQQAIGWWAIGFEDRSPEAFRTILDEMIGLGLLRRASEGTYALRSTNIVNLLGGRKEIEDELEATVAQEPPKPHEHPQLRRAEKAENPLRRSPLTLTQEARILQRESGASVVFGARIADRDYLADYLGSAVRHTTYQRGDFTAWPKLEYAISKLLDRKEPYAVQVVSPASPWTERWVEDAQKLLKKRRSKEAALQVVFLGDPAAAARWCALDGVVQQRLTTQQGIEVLALAPWTDGALRAWFEDCQFGPYNSPAGRARVKDVTGNWAALLHRFGETCRDKHKRWEEHLQALADDLGAAALATLFELPPELVKPLRVLADLQGNMPLEDAMALLDDPSVSADTLRRTLEWARFLGFASDTAPGWNIDPLLAKAVREAP